MELPGQTLETFPLLAQERGTIEREWVSISGKNIAEIRAKLSAAILWLVGKVTFDILKFSNGQDLQTVIKWGCFVAQQTCHWWVWGALGTSVAFAFCIPTPIWAQVSLSLLCWLIQALWCKQGPANLLCPTRTIPNYASLGGLPLKENLFQG